MPIRLKAMPMRVVAFALSLSASLFILSSCGASQSEKDEQEAQGQQLEHGEQTRDVRVQSAPGQEEHEEQEEQLERIDEAVIIGPGARNEAPPDFVFSFAELGGADGPVNQRNNLHLSGFALRLGEQVFLADGDGIHVFDGEFGNRTTLVHASNVEYMFGGGRFTMFEAMQYSDGLIYFMDRSNDALHSMRLDGSELTMVLDVSESGARVINPVVLGDKVYFNYHDSSGRFLEDIHLKAHCMTSGEIVDLGIVGAFMLVPGPDGTLMFSHQLGRLTRYDIASGTAESMLPANMDALVDQGKLVYVAYAALMPDSRIAFSGFGFERRPYSRGSRMFVTNHDGYAEEVFHTDFMVGMYVNYHNGWAYFSNATWELDNLSYRSYHLLRVTVCGEELETIAENAFSRDHYSVEVFMQVLGDGLVLYRSHGLSHETYAAVRLESGQWLGLGRIN